MHPYIHIMLKIMQKKKKKEKQKNFIKKCFNKGDHQIYIQCLNMQ